MKSVGRIGELKYDPDRVLPLKPSEYFRPELLGRGELPFAERGSRTSGHRRRTGSCGAATTRTTSRPIRTPGRACAAPSREHRRTSCSGFVGGNAARRLRLRSGSAAPAGGAGRPHLRRAVAALSRESPKATGRLPSPGHERPSAELGSKRLAGRRALVTGASRGIGAATAQRLAAEGAAVAITARTAERHPTLPGSLRETAEQIDALGVTVVTVLADLTDAEERSTIVPSAERGLGGPIDILVNNAAAAIYQPLADFPAKAATIDLRGECPRPDGPRSGCSSGDGGAGRRVDRQRLERDRASRRTAVPGWPPGLDDGDLWRVQGRSQPSHQRVGRRGLPRLVFASIPSSRVPR